MKYFAIIFAVFTAGLSAISFPAISAEDENGFVILQLSDLAWDENSNRLQTKMLHGNPSEAGLYIMRIRFPPGASSSPHHHGQDRFITVIEGTWYAGTDASHDMNKTVAIPAGGFMKHPAGSVHFDGSKDVATVVEIRGMGPVTTTAVEKAE